MSFATQPDASETVQTSDLLLLNLPVELLLKVLDLLDHRSLLRLSQTCSGLHAVIDEATKFQYKIALGATNTSDSRSTSDFLSLAQRMSEIRRRERAWMRLSYQYAGETRMESSSGVYELQHGLFVQGKRASPLALASNGLRIMPLARSTAAVAGERESASSTASSALPAESEYRLGFEFADFNIDPEQDLAVYACVDESEQIQDGVYGLPLVRNHIRLRRISNRGALHPFACSETLDLGMAYRRGLSFFIQIFGDFVGVLTRSISGIQLVRDTSELLIYNWKTGILQTICMRQHITNFIFLSPSHFMLVTNNNPHGLTICRFQPRRILRRPGFASSDVDIPPPQPAQCIASYTFPLKHPAALTTSDLLCRCEPTPAWTKPDYTVEYAETARNNGISSIRTSLPVLTSLTRHGDSDFIDSSEQPHTLPSYTSCPTVRPGVHDFRIAVLTYGVQRERRTEDFIAFVAVSELFKDALRRLESSFRSPDSGPSSSESFHRSSSPSSSSSSIPDDTNVEWNSEGEEERSGSLNARLGQHERVLRGHIISSLFEVPFSEWGMKHSRFLSGSLSTAWVSYVYMNRVVILMPDPPMDADEEEEDEDELVGIDEGGRRTRGYVSVMDFNPNALRESYPALKGGKWDPKTKPEAGSSSSESSSSPSSLNDGARTEEDFASYVVTSPAYVGHDSFSEVVETSLPYRHFHSYKPIAVGRKYAPLIDAERILLLPDEDDADWASPINFRTLAF